MGGLEVLVVGLSVGLGEKNRRQRLASFAAEIAPNQSAALTIVKGGMRCSRERERQAMRG